MQGRGRWWKREKGDSEEQEGKDEAHENKGRKGRREEKEWYGMETNEGNQIQRLPKKDSREDDFSKINTLLSISRSLDTSRRRNDLLSHSLVHSSRQTHVCL